jgi:hypothetical protein
MGFLIDEGALAFEAGARAANGTDVGAFAMRFDKLPGAVDKLMKKVGAIKATGDRAAAEQLAARYVDGAVVPHKIVTERMLRHPKSSFVYALDL